MKKKISIAISAILSTVIITSPIFISSCSSNSQKPEIKDPTLNQVKIFTNKYNYKENEFITINSEILGENLNDEFLHYQWLIKESGTSKFIEIINQNENILKIKALPKYNHAEFKLRINLKNIVKESNTISIVVQNDDENIPDPTPISDLKISTENNKVNIGQGITFNAFFKDSIPITKVEWFMKKNNDDWKKINSSTSEILDFIILDDSFNNAKIKASTIINGNKVESNEITIFVDTQNYTPPIQVEYPDGPILTPPLIPNGDKPTRKLPHDVSRNIIKSFKVNGISQEIVKLNEYGPTFTVFIEEHKDYNVEINLNTNYKEYGVNLGFKNPKVVFYKTVSQSGVKVLDDGNYNKVVDINKLSPNKATHIIQITGIIQEEGFQSQEFTVSIQLRNKFINQLTEGEDYFKFENMYITNPYTQNEALKNKYGNVPLPIFKDGKFIDPKAEVSKDDLFRMFHLIVSQRWNPLMQFGSRKIWSEYFIDTFIDWLIKNWKYYPELNFNNPKLYFTTNYPNWFFDQYRLNDIYNDPKDGVDLTFRGYETMVNNEYDKNYDNKNGPKISEFLKQHYDAKDIFMTELLNFNLSEKMSYSSKQQDDFLKGLSLFFTNYVRPGMSDKDKVLAVYMFVSDWLRYQGNASNDQYGFWSNHVGVCANYGGISAYLLNLIGVPAIPIVTGDLDDNPVRMLHMNTWIYLDAEGTGKKWYMQDSTFIDNTWGGGSTWPNMRFRGKGDNDPNTFKLLLTDVYKKQYGDYEYDTEHNNAGLEYIIYHNNFFNFFGGQWFRPYLENKVSYGDYNIKQESWMVNQYDNNLLCKPSFHNGYWYFFDKNERFVKTKLIGTENDIIISKVPKWVMDKLTYKTYGGITAAQIGKYVFYSRSSYNEYDDVFGHPEDKWFIVHDLDDINWEHAKYISFDSNMVVNFSGGSIPIKDAALVTYFFDENKMLNLELQGPSNNRDNWRESKIFKFNIFDLWPNELSNLDIGQLNTKSQFDSQGKIISEGDDNVAFNYYTAMGGAIGLLPNKDSNVTWNQKQTYNISLKNILKDQSLTANDKAIKMKQSFNNLIQSSLKTDISNTLIKSLNNDIYQLETKYFNNQYGILFDIKDGFESLDTLGLEEPIGSTRYNIWYSPTKYGSYELLAENLYEPRIIKKYYKDNKKVTGYYYVEYYTLKNPNIKKYSQNIKVEVEESMFYNLPLPPELEIWKYDSNPNINGYSKFYSTSSNYSKFNPKWSHIPYQLRLEWKNVQFYPNEYKELNINLNHIKKDKTIEKEVIANINSTGRNINWIKDLGLINKDNSGIYFIDFEYVNKNGVKYNIYSKICYILEYKDIIENNFNIYNELSNILINLSHNK